MGTTTSSVSASALSALASTPATSKVGPQANQTQMNQFLTLLTTEMKNQDPTQPSDPTAFVAQLAQFSTVEQLVQGNQTLTSMSQNMSGLALGQYAGLINHSVIATAGTVTVPASGSVSAPMNYSISSPSLSNIHVQISDASGNAVGALAVGGTNGSVTFNGTDGLGNALPPGQYSLSLVGTSGTGANAATSSAGTLTTTGTVAGVVQGSAGAWQLQLNNGQTVSAASVTGAG
jgi:flagellar basal-body rod modification protein FlgD